jgi:hypothetical protein
MFRPETLMVNVFWMATKNSNFWKVDRTFLHACSALQEYRTGLQILIAELAKPKHTFISATAMIPEM